MHVIICEETESVWSLGLLSIESFYVLVQLMRRPQTPAQEATKWKLPQLVVQFNFSNSARPREIQFFEKRFEHV